jgi:hypothetical protein
MIDYNALVRCGVSALKTNIKDERQALYERLRNCLAGILRASNPAPTEDQVIEECLALEAAISRVVCPIPESINPSLFISITISFKEE